MSWRIRIEHHSRYEYAGVVHSSYNEARITPITTPSQLVLDATRRGAAHRPSAPLPRLLGVGGPRLRPRTSPTGRWTVIGRSIVETTVPRRPATSSSWDDLRREPSRDDFAELLAPTGQVPPIPG